ncbi:hypothetical protein E6H15_05885, partial [Candidatus Bathyarchaeota archaeon]
MEWHDGLFINTPDLCLALDPSTTRRIPKRARVLVSHAHGDHTGGFRYKGLKQSTQETRDIHHALRYHQVANFHPLKINEKFVIDDSEVKALDAGHMLGSAQFFVDT